MRRAVSKPDTTPRGPVIIPTPEAPRTAPPEVPAVRTDRPSEAPAPAAPVSVGYSLPVAAPQVAVAAPAEVSAPTPTLMVADPLPADVPVSNYFANLETFANLTTPYYLRAGDITTDVATWYQYPALPIAPATGGVVKFVDSSGEHVLESINGNLFYDTELLAKANDIQQIDDWALYPALANVDMNNKALNNVDTVQVQTGLAATVSLTTDASANLLAAGVPLATQPYVTAKVGTVQAEITDVSGRVGVLEGQVSTLTTEVSQLQIDTTKNTNKINDLSANQPLWAQYPASQSLNANGFSVLNASEVGIGASGSNGLLTTGPGGTTLLFNGQPISTGAGGDVSQWAQYAANHLVDLAGNEIYGGAGATTDLQISAERYIKQNADGIYITADNGGDVGTNANLNLIAQNGNRGSINLTANAGAAGVQGEIHLVANGGTIPVAETVTGGLIELVANTPLGAGTSSAIKFSAAGINSYAGAIPSIGSLAGYNFIYGTAGVNICAGLPSTIPSIPTTTYIYGLGGVNLESGFGADVEVKDSTLGVTTVKPRTSSLVNLGDMTITGRSNIIMPNQYVNLGMVKSIAMDSTASISNVSTIGMNSGVITGVSTINGQVYPPPAGSSTDWSEYPAVQDVGMAGFSLNAVAGVNNAGAEIRMDAGDVAMINTGSNSTLYVNKIQGNGSAGGDSTLVLENLTALNPTTNATVTLNGIFEVKKVDTPELHGDVGGSNINVTSTMDFGSGPPVSITAAQEINTNTLSTDRIIGTNVTTISLGNDLVAEAGVNMEADMLTAITTVHTPNIGMPGSAPTIAVTDVSNPPLTLLGAGGVVVQTTPGNAGTLSAGTLNAVQHTGVIFKVQEALPSTAYTYLEWNNTANHLTSMPNGVVASQQTIAYLSDIPTAFRPSYDIYVAPNGNDATGNGSSQAPLQTIAAALTLRGTISAGTEVSINLASGTYTENVTIATVNTYLAGAIATGEVRHPTNISGNITVSAGGTVGVSNVDVTGTISTTNSSTLLALTGVNTTSTTAQALLISSGTAFVSECRFNNGGAAATNMIQINSTGTITMRDCVGTQTLAQTVLSSAGTTNIRQCYFSNTSTSTSNAPIVRFTGTTAQNVEMNYTKLVYTSTAVDVGGNKCCIQFNSASGTINAEVAQMILSCVGAVTGTPQIECIQQVGAAVVNLSYGDLQAVGTAHHIAPTIVKTAMFLVV